MKISGKRLTEPCIRCGERYEVGSRPYGLPEMLVFVSGEKRINVCFACVDKYCSSNTTEDERKKFLKEIGVND